MKESRFERFSTLIESSLKSMNRLKGTFMEAYNLSATHARCLTALLRRQALTQNELADYLGIDRSQISRILKDTIAEGLIASTSDSTYKKSYYLTEAGQNSAKLLESTILKINNYVSGDLPEEDVEVFYRALETITFGLRDATQHFSTPEQMLQD
ncbi:MAG: MarR family transcriptional regulator [Clostridia bacterium]|nr:MarR family transcriptional regulator [Clostridia bacterium]